MDERGRVLPGGGEAEQFYLIKDFFTVPDRDWSAGSAVGGTEEWARQQYQKEWMQSFEHNESSGHPHIYTRVETPDGLPIRNKSVFAWMDDHDRIYESGFEEYIDLALESLEGWGRLELNSHAIYDPRMERGRWCVKPRGFAESVAGLGLPQASDISCFIIWVELPMSDFGSGSPTGSRSPQVLTTQLNTDLSRRLAEQGRENQLIFFNPEATIQRKIIEDGFVPNSGEFEMAFRQDRYVGQQAQHLLTGETRVYYIKRNQWHQVLWIPSEAA